MNSLAESIASLNASDREKIYRRLSDQEAKGLIYDWRFWARPNQLPPDGEWFLWLLLAGRGFGKTRTGAEWIRQRVKDGARLITLIAQDPADARDVMIEGESGILAVHPENERPTYEPSKRLVTWENGAVARVRSGADPDGTRGLNSDTIWADELGSWKYPRETWDNAMLGLRLGDPRVCISTTPKPISLVKDLVARAKGPDGVLVTGSTYENRGNLSPAFFRQITEMYEGTDLGQQELYARILDEAENALWTRKIIEANRVRQDQVPEMRAIVVGIDPAAKSRKENNETGIIVGGLGTNGHGYVFEDASGRMKPDQWGKKAIELYRKYEANRVVYEDNMGGEMVGHVLGTIDKGVPIKGVTATKGKQVRAEPVQSLYQRGMIHHVGTFQQLEDDMCTWQPYEAALDSPDRIDALVWVFTELMVKWAPVTIGRLTG